MQVFLAKDNGGIMMIKRFKQNEIEELAYILRNNGVISVPTDTVYGVCASISSKLAHDKLVKLKNRPTNKAFPVMCANEEQIRNISIVDKRAEKLIKAFMPGPITLVLKKKENLPAYVTNGKVTIAIRMATSKAIEKLILKTGSPIFMTSANQSGKRECVSLDEIEKECPSLNGIMEGKVLFAIGSTIVDCTTDEIKILREGPISPEEIKKVIENE